MSQTTTAPHEAEVTITAIWADGAPLSVPSAAVVVDMQTYRRQRCPLCGRRGMRVVPQQYGQRYRLLLSCRHCSHREVA